ncbi:nucleic acid-binding protein [Haloterrigena sp. H1]|uniref:Zn-ribbon domain-containing OB-fold protein n=1 Tax=Haloterrigena sp. H1 TaxID=2552943 RepID=UPI00110ED2FF|nr:OB-fold domain-containing protein [Haloterrigena sp. H1]TMT81765.1 nucleic acid-binding protein [Haloterrigena sp. H1]TMT81817.1 nucleic acid-binding protein [Haloterrigena sp. H1]
MSVEIACETGYDAWLDALEAGEGYYLRRDGRALVPPAMAGAAADLEREPLPDTGTVEAKTVIRVPHPDFGSDVPYAIAIVEFGPVTLTGQVTGIDPEAVGTGFEVEATVLEAETSGKRFVAFRPVGEVSDR